ncbi:OmpA family protein [Variovorax humicola]|uniref:OmpA family protein n=1 Tax=Variovorax humicola TaxID=1769758 RepID=A0ABU8W3Z2_9BURK
MINRRLGHCLITACAVSLAACSSPGTRVVLLPQEDGTPSAVVVQTKGGDKTLAQPYARAQAAGGASGPPVVDQADPANLRKANSTLFDMAPPKAQRYTLYFEVGGSTLAAASQQNLEHLLTAAGARNGGDILVSGHTDTTGSPPQNDVLSLQRASQVRDMLVERGFPAKRIEAVGRGSRELAMPTGPNVDEPLNRRVTVVVR